jgi:hypothetical protein
MDRILKEELSIKNHGRFNQQAKRVAKASEAFNKTCFSRTARIREIEVNREFIFMIFISTVFSTNVKSYRLKAIG